MSTTSVNHDHLPSADPSEQVAEDPVGDMLVQGNLRPAEIRAVSNLAEDTIFATGGLDALADGPGTLAMFRNPYNGGVEEVLFVDNLQNLWHAWRAEAEPTSPSGSPGGWVVSCVSGAVLTVSALVHPAGGVYAFTTTALVRGGSTPGPLTVWELTPSGSQWVEYQVTGLPADFTSASQLFVQYLNDRPATAVVFAVMKDQTPPDIGVAVLLVGSLTNRKQEAWEYRTKIGVSPRGLFAIGVDDTNITSARSYWVAADGATVWQGYHPLLAGKAVMRVVGTNWGTGVGIWTDLSGAGCVGVSRDGRSLMTCSVWRDGTDEDGVVTTALPLDRGLDDVQVWQDSAGLMHVYGRDAAGDVSVLHQRGRIWAPEYRISLPVWDTHEDSIDIGTTRGLFGGVVSYTIDAFPDDMPNALAVHSGAPSGESVAIYTQQVGTSYWERETVRVVPDEPPVPYTVTRYQSRVTVVNAYGAPVPGCAVTLTSDGPVDLEVAGTFYRTSTRRPISLVTDLAGSLTLRVVADGLSVPNMHLSVPGVAQALTVQAAAEVQKFLSGAGSLPNLPEGFTAKTVAEAKNPDGTPLFPRIRGAVDADLWSPSAAEVVTWCAGAFAVSAKTELPTAMTTGLADGDKVLAFSLQTHDQSRPGFQVYTSQEQLEARRQMLADQGLDQGLLDEASEWFGDLIEGLRAGVTTIAEVAVDIVNATLDVMINLADTAYVWLRGSWDDVVSAAHAVEAIFVALGAQIGQVIDYLKWSFGMGDIWDTKKALQATYDQIAPHMIEMLETARQFGVGWFERHEQDIVNLITAAKDVVAGRTLASVQVPSMPDGMQPPTSALSWVHVGDPHTLWLTELFVRNRTGRHPEPPRPAQSGDDPFQDLITALLASPAWPTALAGLGNMGELFAALFDFSDPQTVYTRAYSALLDVYQSGMLACLYLGDTMLDATITSIQRMLGAIGQMLATRIEDPFVQAVYEYVQVAAGVPDGEREPATIGGFGALYAAFPTTILIKLVLGTPPFPGGTLPDLPPIAPNGAPTDAAGQLSAHDDGSDPGGRITPEKYAFRVGWQLFQGALMAYDAYFDLVVNSTVYYPDYEFPAGVGPHPYFWPANAVAHVFGYAIGDWPWLWGGPTRPAFADSSYLQFASWFGSVFVNLADFFCAMEDKRAMAMFEDTKGIGPGVYSVFGLLRIGISVARYYYTGVQSATDVFNMWINITSFESSASGVARWVVKSQGKDYLPVMHVKNVLDFGCDLFAGGATLYQTIYTLAQWPTVTLVDPPPPMPVTGQPYDEVLVKAVGGWTPYTFALDPRSAPLPKGLEVSASTGHISGTTDDPPGRWAPLFVQVMDYSGPSCGSWITVPFEVLPPAPESGTTEAAMNERILDG